MIRKKLTDSLRERIKAHPNKFRKKDLAGDALTYLNRVRGAAKARKIKRDTTAKVGETTIPKDSELYVLVQAAAKQHNMPVAKYIKTHKEDIDKLVSDGKLFIEREVEYIIKDFERADKIYINGRRAGKGDAMYSIRKFKDEMVRRGAVYPIINIEYAFDLRNNIYIKFPEPDVIEDLETPEDMRALIEEEYSNIKYIPND